ncbi:MAG TPA: hypothetical protein VNZ05_10135 [Solirubrobacteraceae bacterium]|jgi:hypothetical protein|nr:hypothetical protein [Solirubrobacteraceae bacterium]
MPVRPLIATLSAACMLAATCSLVACGSAPSSAATQSEKEADFAKFARCLREHGVEAKQEGAGQLSIGGKGAPANPNALEAAQSACKRYAPRGRKESLSPAQRVAAEEAALKFAQCMRSHGVNVPNPTFSTSGGGFAVRLRGGAGGVRPDAPAFQAAQKACQGFLPKGPGGRGGGPSTSSGGPGSSGAGLTLRGE